MRCFARHTPLIVALVVLALAPAMVAQSLQVIRADGTSATLTAAQIAAAPHVTVNVKDHDTPAEFEGVPLSAVLALAGVQTGGPMRGPQLSQVLLVEASDGYKVVFALAEVDPDFATREILLADKSNGKPLDAKQGPFRIIAPGDKRPARWARMVTTLRIVAVK
jgi:hypothetical protein